MFRSFRDWFWTDAFWLPHGFKWTDVEKKAPLSALYIVPFITVIILILRYVFERYIAIKFCVYVGIVDPSSQLEEYYSSETESPTLKNEKHNNGRSLRKGRRYQQFQKAQKATETCWRCFAYFLFFIYGSYVIFSSDWFWKTSSWLEGYIKTQPFTDGLKWYYYIELAFYIALLVTQFKDTKRKDYMQQFIHHVATIILISGSYLIAHFRYGSVIMLLHDASDYWLEAAKLAKYAKMQRTCDVLFVIFAVVFYLTRWVYFPFWVCGSFMIDNSRLAGPLQSYFTFPYLFLYLCFVLQALHIYWGILIGRMIYNFTVTGNVEKDDRSEGEDD